MAERTIGRAELVRQLGVPPDLVRELLRTYRHWLSQPDGGRYTAQDLARLEIAARGRVAGEAAAEIESRLGATLRPGDPPVPRLADAAREDAAGTGALRESAAGSEAPAAAAGTQAPVAVHVAMELARMRETLSETSERERRDRDRMLTALMRTQQEVASLRQELGATRTRRSRRRGIMSWLRG